MRITILGGTQFIGAATLEELVGGGHEITLVHRGVTEREDLPDVPHAHLDRNDADALAEALAEAGTQVLVDTSAYTRRDATVAVTALPRTARYVVLSSQDVYRQFHQLRHRLPPLDPLPLDETSPVRTGSELYLYRGRERPSHIGEQMAQDYENLDVEDVAIAHGATVLRLPLVYGERDPLQRESFVLDHVRAGADRIQIGVGTLIWSKAWVRDVATAVRLAAESDAADGSVLNISERQSMPVVGWARAILDAAGSSVDLEVVPDDDLDAPMTLTGALSQHMLSDSSKARELLGWQDSDPARALRASVAWHLDSTAFQ